MLTSESSETTDWEVVYTYLEFGEDCQTIDINVRDIGIVVIFKMSLAEIM